MDTKQNNTAVQEPSNKTKTGTIAISTRCSHKQVAASDDVKNIVSMVTLNACEQPSTSARKAINISAVIDRSGSMSGQKLELCISTLEFLIKELTSQDSLSIVSYDTNVRVDAPQTHMTPAAKGSFLAKVKRIRAGSMTNLSGGLLKGIDVLGGGSSTNTNTSGDGDTPSWSFDSIFGSIFGGTPNTNKGKLKLSKKRTPRLQNTTNDTSTNNDRCAQAQATEATETTETPDRDQDAAEPVSGDTTVKAILLLTDGMANHGISDTPGIVKAMGAALKKWPAGDKCSVFTFGYGKDHDQNMLRNISDAGHGLYYFIDQIETIPVAFGDCLGGLCSVVAQNIVVKCEGVNGAKITEIFGKYESQHNANDGSYAITVNDMYAEEQKDILLKVELPESIACANQQNVVRFTVTYVDVLSSDVSKQTAYSTCSRPSPAQLTATYTDVRVMEQYSRIVAANAMEEARKLADKGQRDAARKLLTQAIDSIEQSMLSANTKVKGNDVAKGLVADLRESLDSMRTQERWRGVGSAMTSQKAQGHIMQRSNACQTDSFGTPVYCAYRGKSKMKMVQRAMASANK